jgi:hypothetical protein
MLNPSTADATKDDPTIRRCRGFAKKTGCFIVNLSPYRATNPKDLKKALDAGIDIFQEDKNRAIMENARNVGQFVLAWGASIPPFLDKAARIARQIAGPEALCLGKTKKGEPRHPLFVRKDQPFVRFL